MSRATLGTYTGQVVDLLNPDPETICIEDIARGLALTCRWNGQINTFYSVAQHCVLMMRQFDEVIFKAYAGLHDAAEGLIGDIVSPLKPFLTGFPETEDRILGCILGKWGLSLPLPPEIKIADNRLLVSEAKQLRGGAESINWADSRWVDELGEKIGHDPYDIKIEPWSWERAEQEYLTEIKEVLCALESGLLVLPARERQQ